MAQLESQINKLVNQFSMKYRFYLAERIENQETVFEDATLMDR